MVGFDVLDVAGHGIIELFDQHKLLRVVVGQLLVGLLVTPHVPHHLFDLVAELLHLLETWMLLHDRTDVHWFRLFHFWDAGNWQGWSGTVLT